MEPQHHFVELVQGPRAGSAAKCTCGWLSVPAASEMHARKRWSIHASQQRATLLYSSAAALSTSVQQRNVELALLKTRARQRRAALVEHQAKVHRALWEADQRAGLFRTAQHRMLDCARQLAGLSEVDLWLRYITMGGELGQDQFGRAMRGVDQLPGREFDILSAVLNEEFREAGLGDPVPARRRPPSVARDAG